MDYERALALGQLEVMGQPCAIKTAAEPETVIWEHLQYNVAARRQRTWKVNCCTAGMLLLGFVLITASNALKEGGTKYTDRCANVMGSAALANHANFCKQAISVSPTVTAAQLHYKVMQRPYRMVIRDV